MHSANGCQDDILLALFFFIAMAARLGDAAAVDPSSWYSNDAADTNGVDVEDIGVPRVNINSEVAVCLHICLCFPLISAQTYVCADGEPAAKRWRRDDVCAKSLKQPYGSDYSSKAKI